MDESAQAINAFLVEVFGEILRTEERCLAAGPSNDLSLTELHVIEAVAACCRIPAFGPLPPVRQGALQAHLCIDQTAAAKIALPPRFFSSLVDFKVRSFADKDRDDVQRRVGVDHLAAFKNFACRALFPLAPCRQVYLARDDLRLCHGRHEERFAKHVVVVDIPGRRVLG